jgi:hypothetical protein
VFGGDEDEIAFGAVNQSAFLDTVRELLGEPKPDQPTPPPSTAPSVPVDAAGRLALWRAGAQMIEALTQLYAADEGEWVRSDPELSTRLRTNLAELLRRLDGDRNGRPDG